MIEPPDSPKPRQDPAPLEVWQVGLEPLCRSLADERWRPAGALSRIDSAVAQPGPAQTAAGAQHRRAAHIALRVLIARRAGIDIATAPFEIGPQGKPALASGRQPYFSLSHSGARALIALSVQAGVGIDIEAPRRPRLSERRREQIIAAGIAIAGGQPLPGDTPDRRMLQAWVRLEAIAKGNGEGMGRLLGRLGIFGGGAALPTIPANGGADVRDIALDQDFVAALAGPVSLWDGVVRDFPGQHCINSMLTPSGACT